MSAHPINGRTPATTRTEISELHTFEHWPAKRLWPLVFAMVGLSALGAYLPAEDWPALLLVCPALGVIMFIFVIGFHDAAHDRLHPVKWANDFFGHIVGTLSFVPLDVYRYAHARHHAYLGTQNDPELWPFNDPGMSRSRRVLAAFCELVLGFIYSPLLFLRSVLTGELSPQERKKVIRGYVLCAVKWSAILFMVYDFNLWKLLLILAIIPMSISATMQTINKFIQHLGLHGKTVLGLTRTVVDEHPAGEVVSSAMFFNDYHGTHHRYAKIPYYNLPSATPYTLAHASEFCPVYPNLGCAFLAMLPCLTDPKIGPQWLDGNDWQTRKKTARESAELIGATTSATEEFF